MLLFLTSQYFSQIIFIHYLLLPLFFSHKNKSLIVFILFVSCLLVLLASQSFFGFSHNLINHKIQKLRLGNVGITCPLSLQVPDVHYFRTSSMSPRPQSAEKKRTGLETILRSMRHTMLHAPGK